VSVVARVVIGGIGVAALVHCFHALRSGRMPMMLSSEDAKYWGRKLRFMRAANLGVITLFGFLFVVAAIFGH
jgi:hypothetical protein